MIGGNTIPKEKILDDFFENLREAQMALRDAFKLRASDGMTQDLLADLLSIDKAAVSRRLNGQEHYAFKTLSAMATGLDCKLKIKFLPNESASGHNYCIKLPTESSNFQTKKKPITSTGHENNRKIEIVNPWSI